MHFIIDKSKWRCGASVEFTDTKDLCSLGMGYTSLLNQQGYMCCLGQCMLQEGVPQMYIEKITTPANVAEMYEKVSSIFIDNDPLAEAAMRINDDSNTTIEQKMEKLTVLFKEHGHTIEFIN